MFLSSGAEPDQGALDQLPHSDGDGGVQTVGRQPPAGQFLAQRVKQRQSLASLRPPPLARGESHRFRRRMLDALRALSQAGRKRIYHPVGLSRDGGA